MKNWKASAFVLLFGVTIYAPVQAQTWQAVTAVMPNEKKCPDVPFNFEITLSGSQISLKNAVGNVFGGPVAADGTVSFQYNSPARLGTVIVAGNAHTRQLTMSAPRTLPGCLYALQPLSEAEVAQVLSWRTTIQQVSGNVQNCLPGSRGMVRIRGQALGLYGFDLPDVPFAGVRLRDDGSADTDTQGGAGVSGRMRVKVAPGTRPRLVEFVTYANVCGYRIVPD